MQIQDQPHIGVLGADPAAITQFLRRVQALGGEHAVLLPLSPAAVPDCEPYLCGASTQPPLPKLRAAAEVLAASGCTVIAVPDSAGIFCEQLTAAAGVPVLSTAGAALPQLVGKLRQRASVLCTPGVRAANVYGLAARRYGLHCSYPDAPVQALLGCVQPEKACSEQVLRSIIELELARGNDCVVLDSAQLCAAFAHFGLAARYPQAADGMELLAQAGLFREVYPNETIAGKQLYLVTEDGTESPDFDIDVLEFHKGAAKSVSRMLRASINAGLEYEVWRHKIGIGLLYTARVWEYKTLHNITGSVNFHPIRWFTVTGSYSVIDNRGGAVGLALNLNPSWINFYLATDIVTAKHTPQFIPIKQSIMNVTLGIGVPIGRRSHRIAAYVYDKDRR